MVVVSLPTLVTVSATDGVDLNQTYSSTLDYSPTPEGYTWDCNADDVWKLTAFSFENGDRLRVKATAANVVFGTHQSNVLWAAIFPEPDGQLVSSEIGQGDKITSIWMRFHPSRIGELFPASTVLGRGDATYVAKAKRLARRKLIGSFQVNGKPAIPQKESVVLDCETRDGFPRFFEINTKRSSVRYDDQFQYQQQNRPQPVDRETAKRVLETVWKAFDREYAMFAIKPDVDWAKLADDYRDRLPTVIDDQTLIDLLVELLAHLQDLQVSVRQRGTDIPVFNRDRPINTNRKALSQFFNSVRATEHGLTWCVSKDNIGYIAIDGLVNLELPKAFDAAIEKMENTRALILDLRLNGGGSEPLAREIAGVFLERDSLYARYRNRNGPSHSDLCEPIDRICRTRGPWRYVAPVIVLQGQRTTSSAESFLQMLSQAPQVTTMGDRTAGSGGNPQFLDAGVGIRVGVPQWIDLDLDGKPIEGIGIRPRITIETNSADFRDGIDTVLAKAFEFIRSETPFEGPSLRLRPGSSRPSQSPHIVSVFPDRNATDVQTDTEIRIRFNQPMNPEKFNIEWSTDYRTRPSNVGFRMRGPVRYLAETYEFVFPVRLTPDSLHRIQVVTEDQFH